jgi:hypothetical protein
MARKPRMASSARCGDRNLRPHEPATGRGPRLTNTCCVVFMMAVSMPAVFVFFYHFATDEAIFSVCQLRSGVRGDQKNLTSHKRSSNQQRFAPQLSRTHAIHIVKCPLKTKSSHHLEISKSESPDASHQSVEVRARLSYNTSKTISFQSHNSLCPATSVVVFLPAAQCRPADRPHDAEAQED